MKRLDTVVVRVAQRLSWLLYEPSSSLYELWMADSLPLFLSLLKLRIGDPGSFKSQNWHSKHITVLSTAGSFRWLYVSLDSTAPAFVTSSSTISNPTLAESQSWPLSTPLCSPQLCLLVAFERRVLVLVIVLMILTIPLYQQSRSVSGYEYAVVLK
jgi:hypothetical protein